MKLYVNTTSPFVRLVRLALEEKGLGRSCELVKVDPWNGPEDFRAANAAARVPTLVLEDGTALSEAHLILRYLDAAAQPALYPAEPGALARVLALAAPAFGAMEAATAIIIGRKSAPGFDSDMVGTKRMHTMAEGLRRLNDAPPADFAQGPDIANIAAVTALDYIVLRYPDRDWLADLPALRDWRARQAGRPSVDATLPYI